MILAILLAGALILLVIAGLSDWRDRSGEHRFRSTAEIWSDGRRARRQARWRREQIDYSVMPPDEVDDGS